MWWGLEIKGSAGYGEDLAGGTSTHSGGSKSMGKRGEGCGRGEVGENGISW